MHPIAYLLDIVIFAFNSLLILWIILHWCMYFNIINRYNQLVNSVFMAISKVVCPPIDFIKRFLPAINGFDISPLILLMLCNFFRYTLHYYFG